MSVSLALKVRLPPGVRNAARNRPTGGSAMITPDGTVQFSVNGTVGASYRLDQSNDFQKWSQLEALSLVSNPQTIQVGADFKNQSRFFRVVLP